MASFENSVLRWKSVIDKFLHGNRWQTIKPWSTVETLVFWNLRWCTGMHVFTFDNSWNWYFTHIRNLGDPLIQKLVINLNQLWVIKSCVIIYYLMFPRRTRKWRLFNFMNSAIASQDWKVVRCCDQNKAASCPSSGMPGKTSMTTYKWMSPGCSIMCVVYFFSFLLMESNRTWIDNLQLIHFRGEMSFESSSPNLVTI